MIMPMIVFYLISQRQTKSSQAKRETVWMQRMRIPTYMESNAYRWDRMKLFAECRDCVWTGEGALKRSTKIWLEMTHCWSFHR